MKYKIIPIKKRFYEKVMIPNEDGCMLWNAGKDSWGYGIKELTVPKWVSYDVLEEIE